MHNEENEQKQEGGKYANWCRTKGHNPECSCAYPDPSDIVPMRGALPGTRPMPREK